ncbi:hypothetical protein EDC01DRAFT_204587 [Geopyxis carbonaria]|nr:hypothetical protein EDC01DRAFT_204587 [Geopyxis carbonaria]
MSICLSCRSSLVLRGQPAVLPFLAPAVYTAHWAPGGRRFSSEFGSDGWRSRTATRKMEGRITRRAVEEIRKDLEAQEQPAVEAKKEEPVVRKERRYHFDGDEIAAAVRNLEAVKARITVERTGLENLTKRTWTRRRPEYALVILEDAVRAVERESRQVEGQVKMLDVDRGRLRDVRRQIRWLLDTGLTPAAVAEQFRSAPKGFLDNAAIFAYLILHKRLFRLSMMVMDGLSKTTPPRDFGSAFLMLFKETMAPYEELGELGRLRKRIWAVKFMKLLSTAWHGKSLDLPRQVMYMLAGEVPHEQILETYQMLQKVAPDKMNFNLGLRFVLRLCQPDSQTGVSRWQEAFEILLDMEAKEYPFGRFEMKHAVLRTLDECIQAGNEEYTKRIMEFMVKVGMEVGTAVHNMVINVAAKEGDMKTMLKHFFAMIDSGFAPNQRTHLILHHFYKVQRKHEDCHRVLVNASQGKMSKYLITDMLHNMVLNERPYADVYKEFWRHYDPEYLQRFGIALARGGADDGSEALRRKPQPDDKVVAVMLMSFCQHEHNVAHIWRLYEIYRTFLYTQRRLLETPIRELLIKNGAYIPHILMMGLGKCRGGLPFVARIVEDMHRKTSKVRCDVFTWSILVKFLTLAGRMDAAKRVLPLMQEQALDPNVVTWTTLVKGHVRRRETPEAEFVFSQMLGAGVDPNVQSWNSLLRAYVGDGNDWKAGAAFREMLDMGIEPDHHLLNIVAGVKDRVKFEAGLAGESEQSESMFEDGEVHWPELQSAEDFEAEQRRRKGT